TVRHREDVGWPAIELVLCRIEKTGHERLDRGGAVRLRSRHDNVVSEFLLPVPRTAPGDEGNVSVSLREHGAGVELDGKAGGMRPGERSRQDDGSARIGALDVRIRDAVGMAVREAEARSLPSLRNPVELVLRTIVAGPVAAVVGEPQFLRLRVPVEAHRISYPARHDFHAGAVRVVTADLAVGARVDLADVAGGSDLGVQFSVGSERHVLPIVMHRVGQIEFLGQFDRFAWIAELVLDVVVPEHAIDCEYVEGPVAELETIGLVQSLQQYFGLAPAILINDRIDATD